MRDCRCSLAVKAVLAVAIGSCICAIRVVIAQRTLTYYTSVVIEQRTLTYCTSLQEITIAHSINNLTSHQLSHCFERLPDALEAVSSQSVHFFLNLAL